MSMLTMALPLLNGRQESRVAMAIARASRDARPAGGGDVMRIVCLPPFVRASVIFAACVVGASPAAAQQQQSSQPVVVTGAATDVAPIWFFAQTVPRDGSPQTLFPVKRIEEPARPGALLPLYGSLVGLQVLDIHSTHGAIESGDGRESNPAMQPVVKNSAAFVAVKAGATAGVIWASEKMWKKNRKAAVIFASAVNIAMAAIVANNYRVVSR
jgi:hypothetical protein